MRIHYIKRAALSLCAAMSLGLSATSQVSQSVTNTQNAQAEPLTPPYSETFADESFLESYTIIDSNQDRTKWEPYLGSAQISYNSELDMDDWLITPALNLEGGKMYSFSIEIMTGGSFNETFEVMFGKDKTPEALVNPIIEKTSIAHTVYKAYTGTISPAESGTFYVGIHGCSQKDMLSLSVKNLKIGAAAGASTPSAPSNLVVNTRTNGELKADISLTAPTLDLNGQDLTELESVKLMRDGNLIKTFSTPKPGSELTFVDEVPECSRYTYSAIAVNASGESPAVETKAFVGTLEPSDPTGITLVETSTPGEVTIGWTPVTTDIRGNNLDPEFVTYRIYSEGSQSNLLFSNISGTSKTFKALDDTSVQTFVQYSVVAETKGGISNYVYSPLLPIGPAYSTPYHESFAEGKASHIFGIYPEDYASWSTYTTEDSEIESQDGDNGFLGSEGSYSEDTGTFDTGKIDLSGLTTPTLTFYIYNIIGEDEANNNELSVSVVHNGNSTLLKTFKMYELSDKDGWVKVEVSLNDYKDQIIQLRLFSHHALLPYILIDNIRIDNLNGSGIETTVDSSTKIYGGTGKIIVTGANGQTLSIFTPDGRLISTQKVTETDCYLRHLYRKSRPIRNQSCREITRLISISVNTKCNHKKGTENTIQFLFLPIYKTQAHSETFATL